jgi:hypothetical protein
MERVLIKLASADTPGYLPDGRRVVVVFGDRDEPSCGQDDCDVAENPSHWVDVDVMIEDR